MFDQTQIKHWIPAAEQVWYACARQTCLIRLSKQTKHRPSNTQTKEMFKLFDRMFDGLQILSNTTKHDQTQPNTTKQGGQMVKCLVAKQCLMVFGRQTFPVWTGLNTACRLPCPDKQHSAQTSGAINSGQKRKNLSP